MDPWVRVKTHKIDSLKSLFNCSSSSKCRTRHLRRRDPSIWTKQLQTNKERPAWIDRLESLTERVRPPQMQVAIWGPKCSISSQSKAKSILCWPTGLRSEQPHLGMAITLRATTLTCPRVRVFMDKLAVFHLEVDSKMGAPTYLGTFEQRKI